MTINAAASARHAEAEAPSLPARHSSVEIARVLDARSRTIVNDCVTIFGRSTPKPLEADDCRRIASYLLDAMRGSVTDSVGAQIDNLSKLQRLVVDRSVPPSHLFNFVYLMERRVVDEIALDGRIGATSEWWPMVTQTIRRASFELLATYAERADQHVRSGRISDSLTTVYSREMMDIVLATEFERAQRLACPVSFIVFDVDHLALINERHGYGVGDRVLERLGILIRGFFRQADWVFRLSDDSIAVLLCQLAGEDASSLATRVVSMVEERLAFRDHRSGEQVRVTISAAAITAHGTLGEGLTSERLLAEGDKAMTRAKSAGRNRVEAVALSRSVGA